MSNAPKLPLEWDIEAVREFYAQRGMDFDQLGPRLYSRIGTMQEKTEDGDRFYREYAEFLEKRVQK